MHDTNLLFAEDVGAMLCAFASAGDDENSLQDVCAADPYDVMVDVDEAAWNQQQGPWQHQHVNHFTQQQPYIIYWSIAFYYGH